MHASNYLYMYLISVSSDVRTDLMTKTCLKLDLRVGFQHQAVITNKTKTSLTS